MKCTDAYILIQRYLQYSSSVQLREARGILRQFKESFEKTDGAIEDRVLKDICLHLAETHFKRPDALRKEPCSTIREEYLKRTGKHLDEFYCEMAYRHAADGYTTAVLFSSAPESADDAAEESTEERTGDRADGKEMDAINPGEKNPNEQNPNEQNPKERAEISGVIDAECCLIQIGGTQL